ncbi:hypothetical protein A33M_3225 [Rhodovulum sp. PH10]|nr:hypothetical protein A33M_3225 [Rhodovulum sp. PH10]
MRRVRKPFRKILPSSKSPVATVAIAAKLRIPVKPVLERT